MAESQTPQGTGPAATSGPGQAAQPNPGQSQQQQQQVVRLDDTHTQTCYANLFRVESTPEEMILDVGLNPHPFGAGEVVVPVAQRIVLNHYTAKRLLTVLSMAVQRHEQTFGPLELDARKRVRTNEGAPPQE